jgi:signal transduction histidine kinase/ligand-binding sensor domain-containing protein
MPSPSPFCNWQPRNLLIALLFIAVLQGLLLFGQTRSPAKLQVGHDTWTSKEGAPEFVQALAQTTDGFLWLGTPAGLFRFDGSRFEPFRSPFGDQLLSANVYSLFAPASGGLWIGYTFGGFGFVNHGRVTNYGGEIASSTGSTKNFAQDRDGILWAATGSGLWRFDHASWKPVETEWNELQGGLAEVRFDRDGTLWVLTGNANTATPKQLFYLFPGTSKFQVAQNDLSVDGFVVDPDGYVVTGPVNERQVQDSSGNSKSGLRAYPVFRKGSSEIVDRTNSVWWFDSDKPYLTRLAPSEPRYGGVGKASGATPETYAVVIVMGAKLVDREGNVWFGDSKGIHRFFYSPLVKQKLPKGSADGLYYAVATGSNGEVWISGSTSSGLLALYRAPDGTVEFRKSVHELDNFAYCAPDKTFWFGGPGGLWHLVGSNLVQVDLPSETANLHDFLQTVTQDRLGGVWVSFGRHGLYRFSQGVWTPYGGRKDLPRTGVVIEFTDHLGRVWFGYTKNTLAVLDGDRVQVFGPNDGLKVGNVTAIYGRGAEIWIGGEFGLQQFDHGRFHNIVAVDNEWLRGISGIVETANGDLWLNGLRGIFHIRRSEISEALKDPAYQVKGEHFGQREGLPGLPFQIRPLNTAVEGTDGRLWFTGSDGVVSLDPAQADHEISAPPTSIQSISANDKFYNLASPLRFPAHTSSVLIRYAAVSLSDPEAIRFRYKLEETDKGWHEEAQADPVTYRNLSPGLYHFSVEATDTNGEWSQKAAKLEFTILPAFYQTRTFLFVSMAALVGLVWLGLRLRIRHVAAAIRERAEVRADERVRIARDLHDTLLQGVQGLTLRFHVAAQELPEGSRTRQSMERALEVADRILVEGRDRVTRLRTGHLTLADLADAFEAIVTDLNDGRRVHFTVNVNGRAEDVTPSVLQELYYLGREAITNAFRHSKASEIIVNIKCGSKAVVLEITDNGCGFDLVAQEANPHAGHWGFTGMKERAKAVGAYFECHSVEGKGTEVVVTVPARRAYKKRPAKEQS